MMDSEAGLRLAAVPPGRGEPENFKVGTFSDSHSVFCLPLAGPGSLTVSNLVTVTRLASEQRYRD